MQTVSVVYVEDDHYQHARMLNNLIIILLSNVNRADSAGMHCTGML